MPDITLIALLLSSLFLIAVLILMARNEDGSQLQYSPRKGDRPDGGGSLAATE